MRLLFTHRYFWPDTPFYANMLYVIARHFAARGDDVRVFASQPSYGSTEQMPSPEHREGLTIERVSVLHENKRNVLTRACIMIIYCVALYRQVLRTHPSIERSAIV